jgi:microcin C transport system permease protein
MRSEPPPWSLWSRLDRSGRFALLLLASLALLGILAPLLANAQPLLVLDHGEITLPALSFTPASRFDPLMPAIRADFHDPTLRHALQTQHALILWAPDPHGPNGLVWHAHQAPAPPSWTTPLGTDAADHDVLAGLLYSLRFLFLGGLGLTLSAAAIGTSIGALQGYYGGLPDLIGQRLVEIWNALPVLFLLIALASLLGHSLITLFIAMLALSWTTLIPAIRAETLRARRLDYVRAAYALGLPDHRIILRHILPNASAALLANLPFSFAGAISLLASLSFLHLGPSQGAAALGAFAAQARNHLDAPWLAITAIIGLALILIPSVLLGISLRQALDPRHGS